MYALLVYPFLQFFFIIIIIYKTQLKRKLYKFIDQINDSTNSCENANDHIQTGDLLLTYFQKN